MDVARVAVSHLPSSGAPHITTRHTTSDHNSIQKPLLSPSRLAAPYPSRLAPSLLVAALDDEQASATPSMPAIALHAPAHSAAQRTALSSPDHFWPSVPSDQTAPTAAAAAKTAAAGTVGTSRMHKASLTPAAELAPELLRLAALPHSSALVGACPP